MKNKITVEEIKTEFDVMRQKMFQAVMTFEQTTGMSVKDIQVDRTEFTDGTKKITGIEIEVTL